MSTFSSIFAPVPGALCLIALASPPVIAAEYSADGEASVGGLYNTNPLLTPLDHRDVWGNVLGVAGHATATTETWHLEGGGRLQNYWYTTSNLDTFNQFLNLNGHYQASERNRLGIKGEYAHDSTMSALEDVGEVIFRRVRRNREQVNPSWTYLFDEKTALTLDYQYQNIHYDNRDPRIAYANAKTHYGGVMLVHQYSPRLTLNGLLNYTNYQTPGSIRNLPAAIVDAAGIPRFGTVDTIINDSAIEYGSAVMGGGYKFTETFDASLGVGAQYSHTDAGSQVIFRDNSGHSRVIDQQAGSQGSWSYLLNATATQKLDHGELKFEYARTISPNIYGNLIDDDRFTFTVNHKLATTVDGMARIIYSDRISEDQRLLALNRRYLRAQADVSWRFLENWYLVGSYQYSQQAFDIISIVPDSHAVYLTLKYDMDKFSY